MLTLTILSLILTISYVVMLCAKNNGIPIHLSQSFYILKHKFIFSLFLLSLTFMLLPPLLEITPTEYEFLSFLTGASVAFIGVTPNFMEKFEGKIHSISAYISVVASQLLILLTKPIIIIIWLIAALSMLIYKLLNRENEINYIFWIEIIGLTSIFIYTFSYL